MNASKHYDLRTSLSYLVNATVSKDSMDTVRQNFVVTSDHEIKMGKIIEIMEYLDQPEDQAIHESSGKVGILKNQFLRETIVSKLNPDMLGILGIHETNGVDMNAIRSRSLDNACDEDFESAYESSEMRSLALFASDGTEEILRHFIQANKHLLKKFRLTGDQRALAMLETMYYGDTAIHCGPWVEDEQILGYTELTSLITRGAIGGIIFFEDPMANTNGLTYEPELDSLCQQALVKNLIVTNTPSSALMLANTLRTALKEGRGELIPSFFFSLQHPAAVEFHSDNRGKAEISFEAEFLKLKKELELANREKDQLQQELVFEKSSAAANYKELASIVEGIMDGRVSEAPQLLRRLQNRSSPLTVTEELSPIVGGLEDLEEDDAGSADKDDDLDTASVVYDFARPDSLSVSSRPISRRGRSAGRRTPAVVSLSTDGLTDYYDDDDDGSVLSMSTYKSVASVRRESARENLKKRFAEFMKKHGETKHNEGELLRLVSNMQPKLSQVQNSQEPTVSKESSVSSVTWKELDA